MNRLTRKLENFAPLSEDDKRFLERDEFALNRFGILESALF